MRVLLIVLAAALLTGCAAAPAAPAKSPPVVGKMGERLEKNGVALTVHSLSLDPKAVAYDPNFREGSDTYAVIDLTIENAGRARLDYSPTYFLLKSGDGREYDSGHVAMRGALESGVLAKGEKVRGSLGILVPSEGKDFVLSYTPELTASDTIKASLR